VTAQLVLHGDRAGGRPISGPTTLAMRQPDPVEVARRAWAVLIDPTRWSTSLRGSDEDRAVYAVRRAVPQVDRAFGEVALRAGVGRRLGPGTCKWCLAPLIAQVLGQPEPPFDPAHRRLLGHPCAKCATRLRDRALAAITGRARGSLVASADARTPRGMNSRDPMIDRMGWWQRRLTAKAPAPSYYRRRGRRWPPEAEQLRGRAAQLHRAARAARRAR
jgi:hypothetical protein